MIWTLIALQEYCDHFNCYAEIDGDRGMAFLYWHDGNAMGVTMRTH